MVAAVDGSGENRNNIIYDLPCPPPSSTSDDDRRHQHDHDGPEWEAGVADAEEPRSGEADPIKSNDMNGNGRCDHGACDSSSSSSSMESPGAGGGILQAVVLRPSPHLPQPEAPPGLVDPVVVPPSALTKSATTNGRVAPEEDEPRGGGDAVMGRSVSVGTGRGVGFGSYIRTALARSFATSADVGDRKDEAVTKLQQQEQYQYLQEARSPSPMVTEFHLSGVRVIVRVKDETDGGEAHAGPAEPEPMEESTTKHQPRPQMAIPRAPAPPPASTTSSRISFFSRSNCRDCGAVRSFFRSRLLPYVEINVDVFPSRLKELVRRTGSGSVPQIFFNGRLVGGLVALNSLRNSGEFDRRLGEMMAMPIGGGEAAPEAPVFGVDDDDDDTEEGWKEDPLGGLARSLRERVAVSDRIARMKIVRGCFSGSELVEAVIEHLDCGRKKAVEIGKELERKHFLHHVFRDQGGFQDGPGHLYRFLDQDPAVYSCYNMGRGVSYREPRPASWVGQRITKIMQAILEAYASDDRKRLDYNRISGSEEFRRYVKVAQQLQRVDVFALSSADERLAFFLNLYNAMVIHAVVCVGRPQGGAAAGGVMDRWAYYSDFHYMVGGYPYSLSAIKNGILRANRRQPYSIARSLAAGDKRLELAPTKVNPLIHFGLCDSTRSSPPVRFFSPQGVEAELRNAAREFFRSGAMEADLEKRTVYLTRIIKWYSADFGTEKDVLNWILSFLDATRAGLLTHLLSDGAPVSIVYQDFDWSLNI